MCNFVRFPKALPSVALGLAMLLLSSGCGESKVAVTGKVTYKGNAVKNCTVNFLPKSGIPITTTADDNGNYMAEVPAGECIVTVLAPDEGMSAEAQDSLKKKMIDAAQKGTAVPVAPKTAAMTIPAKYGSLDSTPLKVTIPSKSYTYDIPLED